MVIDEFVEIEFTSPVQVFHWNKKHKTSYKIGDKAIVHWSLLQTSKLYRGKKLKVKCDDCQTIMIKTIHRIKFVDGKNLCKSCIQAGERGYWHTHKKTKEMNEHMSKIFSGKGNPFYGHKHSDEAKEKSRQANLGNTIWRGRKHKKSSLKKLSRTLKNQYRLGLRTVTHGNQHIGHYKNMLFESHYEEFFLKYIDSLGLLDKVERGPVIHYRSIDHKMRSYLPDFFFKDKNLIIEIKSDRYWNLELDNNILKMNAAKRKHKYILIINNNFSEFNKFLIKNYNIDSNQLKDYIKP